MPLAAWLRKQGFAATLPAPASHGACVLASGSGERFELTCTWVTGPVPNATRTLRVLDPQSVWVETLFMAPRVRRLKEMRQLLLGNVRYYSVRLPASSAPLSAPYPFWVMSDTPKITP